MTKNDVPPPPETFVVNELGTVIGVVIVKLEGDARKIDFPAKKLSFKLPDAAVGTVSVGVYGGGRVLVL
jgi:hypothetical protein